MASEQPKNILDIMKLQSRANLIGKVANYAGNTALALLGVSYAAALNHTLPPGLFDAGQNAAVPLYAINVGLAALATHYDNQADQIRSALVTQSDIENSVPPDPVADPGYLNPHLAHHQDLEAS